MRFFIFLLLIPSLLFSQKLSLDQCYQMAENHHPTMGQKEMIARIADLQSKNINRNYLPQLSFNGQATWQSQVTEVNIPLPGIGLVSPPKDQYRFSLDLNQTIWDGGLNNAQLKTVNANKTAEDQKLNVEIWGIRKQVYQLYFGILFAEKQSSQVLTLQKDLNSKRSKVEAAVANGVSIKSDLLRFDAKLLELEQQLSEINLRKNAALEALSMLTGNPVDSSTTFESPEIAETTEQNNRPELKMLDAQQRYLATQQGLIKAKNNPKLFAFAQGAYARPGLNMFTNVFVPYFIGGVRLQVPLTHFYSGQNKLEIAQIGIQQQRIEKQKESFKLGLDIQNSQLKSEITRIEKQIENDKALIEIRGKILKSAEEQWQNGIATSNNYLEEINQKEILEQKLLLHEIQLLQARQELSWTLGNK
jgi:outer membrane protein TolC